jgi:heme/copper-type cytochrome/quinol oxidase subunit 3
MKERAVSDVSALPTYAFGSGSTPWWGTLGFIALEGMGFALAAGTYLYLVHINDQWPLSAAPPNHWPGTLLTVLLLVSLWPNAWIDRIAKAEDLVRVRRGLVLMSVLGLVAIAIRFYEFAHLNVRWDDNAYGSITWVLLGLHATHLITDVGDSLVLTALMYTRHATGRRFSDCSDNAFYWYFVVAAWLPIYALIYWAPRAGGS